MKTVNKPVDKEEKIVTWFSRLLRWGLGGFFLVSGIVYYGKGAWPAIVFGAVILVSGFFRPRRCIGDCTFTPPSPRK